MSTKGTVLIFAYECYPYNRNGSAIGAQRPYQFAQNLAQLGWKVIVVCCDNKKRRSLEARELDQTIEESYQLHHHSLKHEAYTLVPLPSLRFYGFWDRIWINSVKPGPGDTYLGKKFPYSIARRISTFCNQLYYGDYSWSWTPVAGAFVKRMIQEHKVDMIIGEHGPDAGILLADQVSRAYTIPWIADFRDPVLLPFKGLLKSMYAGVVKKIVSSALATINVNAHWTSLDRLHFGKEAYTIVNGYEHEVFERIPAYSFSTFTVSYFGSIKEESQDIIPSLKAFALLLEKTGYPKDVTLFYRGFSKETVLTNAKKIGIEEHYLDIDGFIEREETIARMKGSSVLLIYSFAPHKVKNRYEEKGFYPGKIFEYIGAGAPILLSPSDNGLLASLINEQNKGLASSSVEEAAEFLLQKYKQWQLKTSAHVSRSTDAELYSRHAQAVQLDKILLSYLQR